MTMRNLKVKMVQRHYFWVSLIGLALTVLLLTTLFSSDKPTKRKAHKAPDLVGVIDETFSDDDAGSALVKQQQEFNEFKGELKLLTATLKTIAEQQQKQRDALLVMEKKNKDALSSRLESERGPKSAPPKALLAFNGTDGATPASHSSRGLPQQTALLDTKPHFRTLHIDRFSYAKNNLPPAVRGKNAHTYVPSGTFVKAVVLGGADADASVSSQRSNNSVMLFKLISDGTLPNGKRSNLNGCFVTASSFGDISSERAYVKLDKLSCAKAHQPIIDINVKGWAFFGGKVGIKGVPLMRDGKVMWWAGISGAISGFAKAAQYAQTTQFSGPYGASTSIGGSKIFKYSAFGGAETAMDKIASYYIKRADQYHPVIQVGAGNVVTVVFKEGFSLTGKERHRKLSEESSLNPLSVSNTQADNPMLETNIPQQLVDKIQQAELGSTIKAGDFK